jgi:hypothetical protein
MIYQVNAGSFIYFPKYGIVCMYVCVREVISRRAGGAVRKRGVVVGGGLFIFYFYF